MWKLSLNIVPNVYIYLESSFLPLAWPLSGRSLPKGNQWECWYPGLGPNVVGLPVNLPPKYTPGTPYNPWCPQYPLHPQGVPNAPLCHLYPFQPLSTYTSCQLPNTPLTPLHPLMSLDAPLMAANAPDTPTPPRNLNAPLCHPYPFWPLGTYTSSQPPIHP